MTKKYQVYYVNAEGKFIPFDEDQYDSEQMAIAKIKNLLEEYSNIDFTIIIKYKSNEYV